MERLTTDTLVRHDFNKDIGDLNIVRFEDMFPDLVVAFENGFIAYMQYVLDIEAGNIVEDISKVCTRSLLIELEREVKGFPILPPESTGETLPQMKKLVRSFVTMHYSELSRFPGFKILQFG